MGSTVSHASVTEARRLRRVLDAASDAYICVDPSGTVLDCNRAAEQFFGYSREGLIGAASVELVAPPELRAEYHELRQRLVAVGGTTEPGQVTIVRSDGTKVQVEYSAWVTDDDGELSLHALHRDVTDRTRLQQELAAQVRRFHDAQALAGVGSWEWELATGQVVGTPQLYRIFGLDESTSMRLDTFIDLLHPDDREWVHVEIDAAALANEPLDYEARFVRPDGETIWVAAHGDATMNAEGVPVRLSGTVHDISERKLTELELERLTVTDVLTGLGNRALLDQRLEDTLDATRRSGAPVSLLLLDLDRFKPVNDTHGHEAGDAVLVELARRFAQCTRAGDTLARPGGDEFALVLPDADRGEATGIAQRLVDEASRPVEVDETTTVVVGASVGIAVSTNPLQGVGELRRDADRAMYTAKHGGRSRHVVFTPHLESTGRPPQMVRPREARAWAAYMVELRNEISRRKDEGALPETSRAPTSVLRTLETLLAAIDQLPQRREAAELALPERVELEEFVFHQSMVHDWADAQAQRGVLTVRRSSRAVAFWRQLQDATGQTP